MRERSRQRKVLATYHVNAGTETALGLKISNFLAVGAQVPNFDVAIMSSSSKSLPVF